jgi:head-tail adaptor
MGAGQRDCVIAFIAAATSTDDYNQAVENWGSPTTLATRNAFVKLGSGQEQRQAAQESASQTATFICVRSSTLDAIPMTARIQYDSSQWDITGRSPMSRKEIWFTATRIP